MQLELSPEQSLIQHALDRLVEGFEQMPAEHGSYVHYSLPLRRELADGGFLEIARHDDCGPIDAALVAERIARLPYSVEAAASAIVGPALGIDLAGPLALCEGVGRPTRYLNHARHACLLTEGGIEFFDLCAGDVRGIDAVLAYPLGVLDRKPASAVALGDEKSAEILTLWRIAVAAEAAGLMRAALDLTVAFVKERRQFGRPLGDLQTIQHRLASDEQVVAAAFALTMRAADTLIPLHAATALLYAQQHIRAIVYDCHQFHGAMGLTLEYPLHLWTYRLKYLQGELGGKSRQAEVLAKLLWPAPGSESSLDHAKWRKAFGRSWLGV